MSQLGVALALAVGAVLLTALSFRAGRSWLRLALRIAAAWCVAIALLAAVVPLVVETPGYREDHRE